MQAQKTVTVTTKKGLSEAYQLESPFTSQALGLFLRIQKLVGPALGDLMSESKSIGDAIGGLSARLVESNEGQEIVKALVGWANKKGQALDYDTEFRGERFPLLVGFVRESLDFHYSDFFAELSAVGREAFKAAMLKMGLDLEKLEAEKKKQTTAKLTKKS